MSWNPLDVDNSVLVYNVGTLSGCGLAYFLALPALASGGVIIGAAFGSVLAYKGIRRAMKK